MDDANQAMVRVCVMIPLEVVRQVKEHTRDLQRKNPAMRITQADSYRLLLSQALQREP